jgi:hypothetical protein
MDVAATIANGSSAVTIALAVVAAWKGATTLYRRTLGSRRGLRRKLNRLALGVTNQYVETLFGAPTFQRNLPPGADYVERTYRTPHAWLTLWFSREEAVQLMSITITDPHFRFKTVGVTFDNLKVTLGRSSFSDVRAASTGKRLEIGARTYEYAESYYFGNPGNYGHYVLSFSMLGRGTFNASAVRNTYLWCEGEIPPRQDDDTAVCNPMPRMEPFRAGTTINTLTISAANLPVPQVTKDWVGVSEQLVRGLQMQAANQGLFRWPKKIRALLVSFVSSTET